MQIGFIASRRSVGANTIRFGNEPPLEPLKKYTVILTSDPANSAPGRLNYQVRARNKELVDLFVERLTTWSKAEKLEERVRILSRLENVMMVTLEAPASAVEKIAQFPGVDYCAEDKPRHYSPN